MYTPIRIRKILLLLAAVLVIGTIGCSRENKNSLQDDRQAEDRAIRLTLAVQTYANDDTLENLIAQFNADHPGIDVQLLNLPRDRYDQFLNMRLTSGEGPDVFQLAVGWLYPYISKNWLLD